MRILPWLLASIACDGCATSDPEPEVADPAADGAPLRDIIIVGNSLSGTVSVLDGADFSLLSTVDVIPDRDERITEITLDPVRGPAYLASKRFQELKHFEPTGAHGDRFCDDVVLSPDGKTLYVSRSNLGDVAAFDLATPGQPQLWHARVDGFRADHIALSPSGDRLLVSASTSRKVDVFDPATGEILTAFGGGFAPHQNDYSADGKRIFNGSTGNVLLPHALNALKGARQLTIVDAATFDVIEVHEFEAGIRPTVITADERTMFAQLSYLNGVLRYDLLSRTVVATSDQPKSAFAAANYPTFDDYPHDSAHHGLALSGDGARLCDVGTIDNTVSIVDTATMTVERTIDIGLLPYWATTTADGTRCVVSESGSDSVVVIDYASGEIVQRASVGRLPIRNRTARVPADVIRALAL